MIAIDEDLEMLVSVFLLIWRSDGDSVGVVCCYARPVCCFWREREWHVEDCSGMVDAVGVESWLGWSVRRISGMTEMSSLSFTHHMIIFFFLRPRFEGLYLNKSSNQEKIPIRTYSLTKAYIKFFNFFFFLNFHLIHGN